MLLICGWTCKSPTSRLTFFYMYFYVLYYSMCSCNVIIRGPHKWCTCAIEINNSHQIKYYNACLHCLKDFHLSRCRRNKLHQAITLVFLHQKKRCGCRRIGWLQMNAARAEMWWKHCQDPTLGDKTRTFYTGTKHFHLVNMQIAESASHVKYVSLYFFHPARWVTEKKSEDQAMTPGFSPDNKTKTVMCTTWLKRDLHRFITKLHCLYCHWKKKTLY